MRVVLPAQASSVAAARRMAHDVLRRWDEHDAADIVMLLVSELVTNAVLHAGSDIAVDVRRVRRRIRVEVADTSPVLPSRHHYGSDATTGRGLGLVGRLSASWGVLPHAGTGKTVWFEVPAASDTDVDAEADAGVAGLPEQSGDDVVVRLLGAPVHLFRAMQQHTDALLREYTLVALQDGNGARPHLDVNRTAVPVQLDAAAETGSSTADLIVSAPRIAEASIRTVRDALAEADRMAADGLLLTPPALPEIRACRSWMLGQVRDQLAGLEPRRWRPEPVTAARRPAGVDLAGAIEHLGLAVVLADDENHITYANRAAEALLGWGPGALAGRRLTTIIPERLHDAHVAGYTRYLVSGQPQLVGRNARVPARRSDGSEVDIELHLNGYRATGGRRAFAATLRDLRPAGAPTSGLQRWLAAIGDVAALLHEGGSLAAVAADVVALLGRTLDWSAGALWVVDGDVLVCGAVWPERDTPFARATGQGRFGRGIGLPGRTWKQGAPEWIADIVADANFPRATMAAAEGLRTGCAFPVTAGDRVTGVVELFSDRVIDRDPDVLAVLGTIGRVLGGAQPTP